MQLFKTPFSRAYWRCALADSKKLRTLVFSALMVAVCVALSYLRSVPIVNNIKITWGFLGRALCALVCGPVNAIAFGIVEDTVSYFINPDGGYIPYYVLTTVLGVMTYALVLYRAKVTVWRIALAKLLTNLQNVFLGSLGTYLFFNSSTKGYWVIAGASAVKNAVMLPVQIVLLVILFGAIIPILIRLGLLPPGADGLGTSRLLGLLRRDKADKA